jgi:predicted DNA-binding transcriptional regulator AlpA
MAEDCTYVYLAHTPVGVPVVAIAPEHVDPLANKLLWYSIEDSSLNAMLGNLGYSAATLEPHPVLANVQYGSTSLVAHATLIPAAKAAAAAGCETNTWRVYSRRGHAPKPFDDGKRPQWVDAEVEWWVAHRKGRGNRTDKTTPIMVARTGSN